MKRKRPKPEVPGEEVPVVECFDGLARITSKELAPTRCGKWHPSRMLLLQDKNGCRFGEKCSYAHREVDEQHSKVQWLYCRNVIGTKLREPVVIPDKNHERPGRPVVKRDTRHELKQGPVGHPTHNYWVAYFKT